VAEVYREFVPDGKGSPSGGRGEALDKLMKQFATRADEALNLPLGRLLEGETA